LGKIHFWVLFIGVNYVYYFQIIKLPPKARNLNIIILFKIIKNIELNINSGSCYLPSPFILRVSISVICVVLSVPFNYTLSTLTSIAMVLPLLISYFSHGKKSQIVRSRVAALALTTSTYCRHKVLLVQDLTIKGLCGSLFEKEYKQLLQVNLQRRFFTSSKYNSLTTPLLDSKISITVKAKENNIASSLLQPADRSIENFVDVEEAEFNENLNQKQERGRSQQIQKINLEKIKVKFSCADSFNIKN
jgi:hypothetical protein